MNTNVTFTNLKGIQDFTNLKGMQDRPEPGTTLSESCWQRVAQLSADSMELANLNVVFDERSGVAYIAADAVKGEVKVPGGLDFIAPLAVLFVSSLKSVQDSKKKLVHACKVYAETEALSRENTSAWLAWRDAVREYADAWEVGLLTAEKTSFTILSKMKM